MICSVSGCELSTQCRGLCSMHYARERRHGDPTTKVRPGTKPVHILERLADKFLVGDGCWDWTGCSSDLGYGQFRVGSMADGTALNAQAHRVLYELMVGPIPEGLHLDHLCNRPACVRPSHLEPVTQAENNRRAAERRETCRRGHRWTAASTYIRPSGSRECRTCRYQSEDIGYAIKHIS